MVSQDVIYLLCQLISRLIHCFMVIYISSFYKKIKVFYSTIYIYILFFQQCYFLNRNEDDDIDSRI